MQTALGHLEDTLSLLTIGVVLSLVMLCLLYRCLMWGKAAFYTSVYQQPLQRHLQAHSVTIEVSDSGGYQVVE